MRRRGQREAEQRTASLQEYKCSHNIRLVLLAELFKTCVVVQVELDEVPTGS